jgi:hypothetical protein
LLGQPSAGIGHGNLFARVCSTGTVFMWSPRENTTRNAILEELDEDVTQDRHIASPLNH